MIKKIIISFLLLTNVSFASGLYSNLNGINLGYQYSDTKHFDTSNINLVGQHIIKPHIFSFKFQHIGNDEDLTNLAVGYSYKQSAHWFGGSISSPSDEPYSRLDVMEFDIFYAFRIFESIVKYSEQAGKRLPHHSRLYLGIDYSRERILLDGYPLPIIRYEYNSPQVDVILGFPLTEVKLYVANGQMFYLSYVPIREFKAEYSINFFKIMSVALAFEMQHEKFRRVSDIIRTGDSDMKYYKETTLATLKYGVVLAEVAKISPYVSFIIDGARYTGKEFDKTSNKIYTGMGYAVGINFELNF